MIRRDRQQLIRALFDEYIEMYAGRDDTLTGRFSENFNGFPGCGDCLVKDRETWVTITRQDFTQVPSPLRFEILDVSMQDLSEDVVTVTAFAHIHLPTRDPIFSQEIVRLLLIFRQEAQEWKIVHCTYSVPYQRAKDGEVFPLTNLGERNRELEKLVAERTHALEEANAKLEALSNTDGLTGIANRRHFDFLLAQEWNRARRTGAPLALIMLDVDHFKHYNDCLGHLAGDSCLKALAETLARAERRAGKLVARYGGEEFVVLLPDTDMHHAQETARHIQREVWSLALPHPEALPDIVTVSLGVASIIPTMQNIPEDLVREADCALYQAKHLGRNRVHPGPGDPAYPCNGPVDTGRNE